MRLPGAFALLFALSLVGPAQELRFAFVGDLMPGSDHPSREWLPADMGLLFAPAAAVLTNVDVAAGNLEGALAGTDCPVPKKGKNSFSFRIPTNAAAVLKAAGFKALNLANNHSLDAGWAGLVAATNLLSRQGILPVGLKDSPVFHTVKGRKIGWLGFSPYGQHHNVNELEAARAVIRSNAARCDLLIVSMHAGAEGEGASRVPRVNETYFSESRGDVYRFAHLAIDEGAAVVFGHGPHVLRGIEVYKDRLIAYSLGNFVGHRMFNVTGALGISCILEAVLDGKGRFVRGQVHPFVLNAIAPTLPDPEKRAIALLRELSAKDFPESAPLITPEGALTPRPK